MDSDNYDVVVIGGGLAGLVAAVRCTEFGLRPVVLEKGTGAAYACNSRFSGGIFHLAYTEMKAPAAQIAEAIRGETDGLADPALAQALIADAPRIVDWLREKGARFIAIGQTTWERWLLAPPRPLRSGLVWQGLGPDVLLRKLTEHLIRGGGMVHDASRAVALRVHAEGVDVTVSRAGRDRTLAARAVVIADGGFQADPQMFKAHIGPRPDLIKQRGAATGCGDGIRMAAEAGAALRGMNRFYGHLLAGEAMTSDALWPYPQLDPIAVAGILVDRTGKRVFDEGTGGIALANELARLPDPLAITALFDAAIWEGPGRTNRIPANPNVELGGGTVYRADTIAGLARAIEVDAAELDRTVSAYNKALGEGRTQALQPPRRVDRYPALPIAKPPFMAVRLCAGITYTMGGIAIDADARVLRPDGSAIDRLYSAGAATGGIEGGGSGGGYVGGLSKASIFGLRAAEHIARRLSA